jgi:hypothetical protein
MDSLCTKFVVTVKVLQGIASGQWHIGPFGSARDEDRTAFSVSEKEEAE